MSKITRFEDLECWKEARKIVNCVYSVSRADGFRKDFSFVDQVRRAAISVMANISEGFSRKGNKEFIHFLFISKSSAAEVQSHRYVALDQKYINETEFDLIYQQAEKISRMISGLIKYLNSQLHQPKQPK